MAIKKGHILIKEFFIYLLLIVFLTIWVVWHYINYDKDKSKNTLLSFVKIAKIVKPSIGVSTLNNNSFYISKFHNHKFYLDNTNLNRIYPQMPNMKKVGFVYE